MKVVYKKTLRERIKEEILKSLAEGKEIEKIILTKEELEEFKANPTFIPIYASERLVCGSPSSPGKSFKIEVEKYED